ncbi:MAG: histone [Candidatus Aenigmatarchaeota archaeon]
MPHLSLLAFEHIAKKAGVKRISKSAVEELRYQMEELARTVARNGVQVSEHAHRNTVMKRDIEFVAKKS